MGETGQKNFWNEISLIRFASRPVYYLREYAALLPAYCTPATF